MMKSMLAGAAIALSVLSGAAQAAPVLLGSFVHNYGSDPGRIDPGGNDVLNPTSVTVSDQSSARFNDAFTFAALVFDTIDRFELTLTFAGAGPSGTLLQCLVNNPACEFWQVRINGSNDSAATDDIFATLVSSASPQTFTVNAASDTGTIDAFATTVANRTFSFWFSEQTGGPDSFTLSSAKLEIYGTVAPIPLPAAGWLMLAGIGGLAALRRRRRAA